MLIPERVGFARAAEMAMLGERVPAPKALEWGLINRVVGDETLQDEADALADRLAAGPTRSYAGTKRQLNAWQFARMEANWSSRRAIQQEMAGSQRLHRGRDRLRGEAASRASRVAELTAARRRPRRSLYSRPSCLKDVLRRLLLALPAALAGSPDRRPGRPRGPAVP